MGCSYRNPQLRFQYPDGWVLDETRSPEGLTVSLQGPSSMFLFLTVFDKKVSCQEVADQALETMRQEYPDLESSPVSETFANLPAVGHDVNFFCLDLTNTCWIRAFASPLRTILLFAQANDLDLKTGRPVFESICGSIELT